MTEMMRFEDRMSDSDALMWSIEKDPTLRSTITTALVFDRAPDRARLVERMERACRLVPRLRQRVVANTYSIAPPRWETSRDFDLEYHLRWMRAPAEGGLEGLRRIAEPIAMQGFDRARPLWEMTVVEGLADGRAGVILKIHHAITDGVGGVKLAMNVFDLERDPAQADPMPQDPEIHVMNQMERMRDAIDHERRRQLGIAKRAVPAVAGGVARLLSDPGATTRRVVEVLGSVGRMLAPASTPLSPVMTGRSLSVRLDTLSVPLADAKAAAKAAGGKLNDFFVAATIGGFRRYHNVHGARPESLRMSMPINLRDATTADLAGNQFAPVRFVVPIQIEDPRERMQTLRRLVAEQRAEPAMALIDPLASVVKRLPTSISTGLLGSMMRAVDFVTSNVPGIPIPLYLGGAQMESQFPFGPLAGAAVNVTLLSYLDQLHIGVTIDPAAVPDISVLHTCLQDGFDEVLKVT
jgi:diacylglycerol O-acyltransferase